MNLVSFVPVILFLVAATLFMGLISPAYAIFPVFVLFVVGVGLFFRPWGKKKLIRRAPASPRPREQPQHFDGSYSPYAYSRLSLLDEVTRKRQERQERHASDPRPDEEIGNEVRARIAADLALKTAGIEAESRFGRVTLRGRVRDEADRDRARALAAAVPGVVEVSVQLRVSSRSAGGRTA